LLLFSKFTAAKLTNISSVATNILEKFSTKGKEVEEIKVFEVIRSFR